MDPKSVVLSAQDVLATRSFDEIHDQVGEACEWIASMDVRVAGTRLAAYQRDMKNLAANYQGGQEALDRLLQQFPNLLNSALEAMDLVTIHRGLSSYSDHKSLRERLHMLISGPEFGADENASSSNNRARNYSYELLMAARAAASGYEVDLSHIADVVLRKGEKTIYIECKRPQTAGKVNRNVKAALEQLSRRMNDDPKPESARAVMALAIDKAIPVAHKLLHTRNEHTAGAGIERVVTQFYDEHKSILNGERDARTICVLLTLRTLTILAEENLIAVACHDNLYERTGGSLSRLNTSKYSRLEDRGRAAADYRLVEDFARSCKSTAYL